MTTEEIFWALVALKAISISVSAVVGTASLAVYLYLKASGNARKSSRNGESR